MGSQSNENTCQVEENLKKKRWSYFIRKVYETDPLTCPKCQGEIRIISFIDQPDVIRKILQPLGLWEEAHASHSIAVATRNPACSKPRLRPPAPAKRSRTLGPVRLIGVFSWKYEQQGQLGTCSRRTRVIWSIHCSSSMAIRTVLIAMTYCTCIIIMEKSRNENVLSTHPVAIATFTTSVTMSA